MTIIRSAAEDMAKIEIERIPAHQGESQQVYFDLDTRKKKKVNTACVRITVVGTDGTEITDIWTRDRFWAFFRSANMLIADD